MQTAVRRTTAVLAALAVASTTALAVAAGVHVADTLGSRSPHRAAAPVPAAVRVDATDDLGPISPQTRGLHVPAWNEPAYVNGALDPRLSAGLDRGRYKYLIFPGGGYGYHYIWNKPNLPTEITTDQFLSIADQTGAQPRIDVNLNATPQLAADWVRYTNTTRRTHVRYWQLGDEPWLYFSSDEFIAKAKMFITAMRRVDPSIKIIANINPVNEKYSKAEINALGSMVDVWSVHFFPLPPSKAVDPDSPYDEAHKGKYYADLLATPAAFVSSLGNARSWVRAAFPQKKFEWQLGSFAPVWEHPETWTMNALPDGLWALDMFGAIDTQHLDAAANWAMMNPLPTTGGDYGMFTPTMQTTVIGRAEELYAQHWGDRLVRAESDHDGLASYASLSADRSTLYVMLVNNDPDHDATTRISLTGFAPRGDAAAWVLDGPTNADRIEDYGVRRELVSVPSDAFTRTVPAYTGEVLEIPVAGSTATLGTAPNLAQDKYATASSSAFHGVSDAMSTDQFIPRNGADGLDTTRWAAAAFVQEPAWFQVDLGTRQPFDRVELNWEYWSTAYAVQVSDDGEHWTTVATQADATAIRKPPEPIDEVRLAHPATGRFVRVTMTGRPAASQGAADASTWTPNTFSLWEFGVYLGR